ncbi:MAG: type II secretion system protein [Elusimicrobiaceae bacterium]|nr:type II secretion system protein [Elusimicrobiaceae bacterium]
MKNNKGFTLTEILLAVMIVGLIAISLASLTRAAARESGVGRSRIMLRNNLSRFMRTLRTDIMTASRVDDCALCDVSGDTASFTVEAGKSKLLLRLTKNATKDNVAISDKDGAPVSVSYCFENGTDTTNIMPEDAIRGGKIYRYEHSVDDTPECDDVIDEAEVILTHVKYIPSTSASGYKVPLIGRRNYSREGMNSMLRVNIITELNSTPIVNETVEETFMVPIGY